MMEVGNEGRLSFLGTLIIIENQKIVFDGYHKTTFSGRFLNFHSHHPLCHKKGVIIGMVDKIILLSHPRFHQKNLINAVNIFLNNGYSIQFIFSTMEKRIKYHINKSREVHVNLHTHIKDKFFTVPYVKTIFESFSSISMRFRCKLAYRGEPLSPTIPNTLKSFIKKGKDQLELLSNQNVVYKISCDDCEASYVGKTKRNLKTRLHEHISDINKKTGSSTVVTDHRVNYNHSFNWKDVKILDNEPSYNKRLISEMVHIKR
ncbi:hypothetical protein ALC60_14208 [Trachymyrmex zeteki]|uniref:GIY-YIG domain-containing protein n=1 Tax=Mycetomoellerius zeteki TaxID=64791 RepID=A0A151WG22_9HYME|nr:hypothetical protein ALC60_14208 [Trachymyrmex zeteki]